MIGLQLPDSRKQHIDIEVIIFFKFRGSQEFFHLFIGNGGGRASQVGEVEGRFFSETDSHDHFFQRDAINFPTSEHSAEGFDIRVTSFNGVRDRSFVAFIGESPGILFEIAIEILFNLEDVNQKDSEEANEDKIGMKGIFFIGEIHIREDFKISGKAVSFQEAADYFRSIRTIFEQSGDIDIIDKGNDSDSAQNNKSDN